MSEDLICHDLVYADDTLLVETVTTHLQAYMECIAACGQKYGLQLNWSKVEQLNINCDRDALLDPHGNPITCKQTLKYLGAQLAADGHIESEIAQKFGRASQDFKTLIRL